MDTNDTNSWRDSLPRPVFDARPELCDLYYKAWELAHTHIANVPGLPAPRYMDAGHRSDRIWIWDTCFMSLFCKYCPEEFPGVESLENFYGILMDRGDEPLPLVRGNRWCGADEGRMMPFMVHIADNPPLFAWVELEYALQTGDRAHLEKVYSERRWLPRWFERFDAFDPDAPKPFGVSAPVRLKRVPGGYRWHGGASGMDNTARGRDGDGPSSDFDGCVVRDDLLWLDALAQQGLAALCLSRIATLLDRDGEAAAWRTRWAALRDELNALYWDEADGFYYDIRESDRAKVRVPSIASYWPLLAEMPTPDMADRLVAKLRAPAMFGGDIPMPSLARSDADFWPTGGYWRGGVWLPTSYMTVKALDARGDWALARDLATRLVSDMRRTYDEMEPHTIWECYSPTEAKPSAYAKKPGFVRPDFCGWSALGPISLFIEDVIGVKRADAFANRLVCDFPAEPEGRVGVENYRFGEVVCDLVATKGELAVESNRPFTLVADGRDRTVPAGQSVFARP